ncbi:hypothetical protein GCM10011514_41250 [Emticicia aquatilis]|uniref:Uncharacterized protein n=1 Tax=Emticicia aquatilis TaxID=1537369 RepID=A0A917DWC7_9BACT|nr:hypothetical protein [Emticicia aquatilis]GGD72907.1 hypothetical protein GCM10011514_41250 [Emticicia aquatilis]
MKNKIIIFLLFFPFIVSAQTVETQEEKDTKAAATKQFKKDSTELARKKTLTGLANDINGLERTDDAAISKAKLDEISNNLKAFGENKLTPLSGDITISEGKFSTAETKALVDDALNGAIQQFKNSLTASIGDKEVLVYDASHFKGIYQYRIIESELKKISSNYEDLKNEITPPVVEPSSVAAGIALGVSVARAVADLATIFKTETQITVNNETVAESYIISKIVKELNNKKFYYPSLFPINPTDDSELLKKLSEIEASKDKILAGIKKFKKDKKINETNENIDKKNTELAKKNVELLKAKKDSPKDTINIKKEINIINGEIAVLKQSIEAVSKTLSGFEEELKKINTEYDLITESLKQAINKETNVTAMGILLSVEQIYKKLKTDSALTLRISANGIGTTIVKKSQWKTKLSSTGALQIEYLLFEKSGKILDSDAFNKYGEKSFNNNLR